MSVGFTIEMLHDLINKIYAYVRLSICTATMYEVISIDRLDKILNNAFMRYTMLFIWAKGVVNAYVGKSLLRPF